MCNRGIIYKTAAKEEIFGFDGSLKSSFGFGVISNALLLSCISFFLLFMGKIVGYTCDACNLILFQNDSPYIISDGVTLVEEFYFNFKPSRSWRYSSMHGFS